MTPQKFVGKKIKTALFHLNKVSVYKIFKKTSLKSGSVTNTFRMTINIDQHSENIIVISNFLIYHQSYQII